MLRYVGKVSTKVYSLCISLLSICMCVSFRDILGTWSRGGELGEGRNGEREGRRGEEKGEEEKGR